MGIHPEYLYLQSLGSKLTGLVWIEYLIRKLWDALRGTWNHRNHNLHTTEGKVKMALLENINNRVRFNLRRGMFRLPYRCKFLFNKNLHSLLSWPVRQRISWIASVSSARLCSQWQTPQSIPKKGTNQSLIYHIIESWLIPSLTKKDQNPPIHTNISLNRPITIHIEWEGEIDETWHPDNYEWINDIRNHYNLSHPKAANKT